MKLFHKVFGFGFVLKLGKFLITVDLKVGSKLWDTNYFISQEESSRTRKLLQQLAFSL